MAVTLGASVVSHVYDATGCRVAKTESGGTRYYALDYSDPFKRPLAELTDAGAVVRRYIWAGSLLLAMVDSNGVVRYVHSDGQGSVIALTDAGGNVTDQWAWGPYGEPWGRIGTNDLSFTWLGGSGVRSLGNGLYATHHRLYDANLRRFLQTDPMGIGGGANVYAYGNLNPLLYVDPLGLYAGVDDLIAVVGGAIGGLAMQGVGDLVRGEASSWRHYLAAGIGGAAGAEAALYTGPGGLAVHAAVGGAVGGLVGNSARQVLDASSGNQESYSFSSAATEAAMGGAFGAVGGYAGSRALPASLRTMTNPTKGALGEGLSLVDNMMQGRIPVAQQQRIPVGNTYTRVDWQFRTPNGSLVNVESKFGTATLTSPQRLASRSVPNYQVDRWSYSWFSREGAALGASIGYGTGAQRPINK